MSRGQRESTEENFCAAVVEGFHGFERARPIRIAGPIAIVGIAFYVGPSGQRASVGLDHGLVVSGNGLAVLQDERAILIELPDADGEKLHQFAAEILIATRSARRAGNIHAGIVGDVLILAHGRVHGHVFHDLPVIGERVVVVHAQVSQIHLFDVDHHP